MTAGALVLLVALIYAKAYLNFGNVVTDGEVVKAEVLRLGTRPVARVAGGELPILTVRLPDGSVRQVKATWPHVKDCKRGRWISILQHGTALQVGTPGCYTAH